MFVHLLFLFQPVGVTKEIQKSLFVQNYKNEPKFHVHGQLGAKIAQEFGIDVSAIDSFTVSMDVGTVVKREVGWELLNEALADKTLNLDHEFVQYILHKPRRSLCIVYETVATGSDADVNSNSLEEGNSRFLSKDGASFCYCAYVLCISGYSGFVNEFVP